MKEQETMPPIRFETKLFNIGSWTILLLPKSASTQLPSRGMAMVEGTINGFRFQSPLEPDGRGSHWFRVDKNLSKAAKADVGDTVTLAIEPSEKWPEPKVPADLMSALKAAPKEYKLWKDITPSARWDWIRWVGSTKNPDTRKHHIEVALSKLKSGMRRPCCFNRSACTEPAVSKGGILLEPTNLSRKN